MSSQRRLRSPLVLLGISVAAVLIAIGVRQNQHKANDGSRDDQAEVEAGDQLAPNDDSPDSLALLTLATNDDIPGLTSLIENLEVNRADLSEMVGRDPRMFERGCSPERTTLLQELAATHEALATRSENSDIQSRRESAYAKFILTLIAAEIEHGQSAGAWAEQASQELEQLHREDTSHWGTRLRLARFHRLLGEVETNQQHHELAFAHHLFASDLIRDAVEQSPNDAKLQLEWGLHLTYLGEAQLKFDKPQLALQSFGGANDCFTKCAELLGVAPNSESDPVAYALWQTQDANRRYFEAYNNYETAMLLTRGGRSLDAREYWSRSLDTFEALAEEFPESIRHRQRYAQAVSNEGSRLATANERQEALSVFVQAADLYSELVDADPHGANNHQGLAMALGNQEMMLAMLDRNREALDAGRQSLAAWEQFAELRPNGNVTFREAVVWKTAELLAQQVVESLPTDSAHALDLAHEHQQLISSSDDDNRLLQEMVTLFELELVMTENCCQHAEALMQAGDSDEVAQWVQVIAPTVARLVQRQPDDERVLNVQVRLSALQSPSP